VPGSGRRAEGVLIPAGAFLLAGLAFLNADFWHALPAGAGAWVRPVLPRLAGNLAVSLGLFLVAGCYLLLLARLGDRCWRWLSRVNRGPGDGVWALACGIVVYSFFLLGAGLSGILYSPLILGALVAVPVAVGPGPVAGKVVRALRGLNWSVAPYALPLVVAAPWLLTGPLLPPTNVDTVSRNLGVPSLWWLCHRIYAMAGNPHFSYPMGFERLAMPYLSLGLDGGLSAFYVVLLAVTGVLFSDALRRAGVPLHAAGGWLLFGCGSLLAMAWDGHPDTGLVFGVTLGVHALAGGGAAGLCVACSVACLCKYTGYPISLALIAAWGMAGGGWRRRMGALILPGLVTVVPVACVAARSWYDTGSPVFPFASRWFGTIGWHDWNSALLWGCMKDASVELGWGTPAEALREYGLVFWKGAKSSWFNPLVVLFYLLPLAVLARGVPRIVRVIAVQGILYAVVWVFPEPKFGRYLVPEIPAALTALLYLLGGATAGRKALAGVLAGLGALTFVAGVRNAIMPPERVLLGRVDRAGYGRAILGGYWDAVDWVNEACPRRARVLVIGGSQGYGLNRPWTWTDDACIPAWLLAVGGELGVRRIGVGLKQRGVGLILYNPVRAQHRCHWADPYPLSPAWMADYAEAWRTGADRVWAAEQFDWTGGWYVYSFGRMPGLRSAAAPGHPWVPGLERLLYDEAAFSIGAVDERIMRVQRQVLGGTGAASYQRSLHAIFVEKNRKEGIRLAKEAIRLGLTTPWVYDNLAIMLYSDGNSREARMWAARALRLLPGDATAEWLIAQIDRGATPR